MLLARTPRQASPSIAPRMRQRFEGVTMQIHSMSYRYLQSASGLRSGLQVSHSPVMVTGAAGRLLLFAWCW